jgi:prophage regulatory protein
MRNGFMPETADKSDNEMERDRPYAIGTSRMSSIQLLRLPQVIERTGVKKTKLYGLQKEGDFPMRIQITANSVGWVEEEVNAWIAERVAASRQRQLRVR